MAEPHNPNLARVSMSASYYRAMQRDIEAAANACNEAYSLIMAARGGSYSELSSLITTLDGMFRDIRNKIEHYLTPL